MMNSMMECISQQEAAHKATNDRLDVITNAITPPAADETEKTTLSDQSCCTSGSQPGKKLAGHCSSKHGA